MVFNNRYALFLFLAFALILLPQAASAQEPFTLDVLTEKQSVYVGNSVEYSFNITNNLNSTAEVQLIPPITYNNWFPTQQNHTVEIGPGESVQMPARIVPSAGTPSGSIAMTVSVCKTRSDICSEAFVNMLVIDKSQLKLTVFDSEKEEIDRGSPAKLYFKLKNFGESNIFGYKLALEAYRDGGLHSKKDIDLDMIRGYLSYPEEGNASVLLDLGDIGSYDIRAKIIDSTGGVVQTEETSVVVVLPPEVPTEIVKKTEDPGIFTNTIQYKINNLDSMENEVVVSDPIFISRYLYDFSKVPDSYQYVEGDEVAGWSCNLAPQGEEGDSCSFSMVVHYWVIYAIVLMLIFIAYGVYRIMEMPRIKKVHMKKGDVHSIHIHVMNNSNKPIDHVIVSDKVPAVLKLVGDYTVKPTSVKKCNSAICIKWDIGKLKPKEDRVLTYKVKPVMEVEGGISLPSVQINAVNWRGKKERVDSGSITIE